jgi:hypothetical protein
MKPETTARVAVKRARNCKFSVNMGTYLQGSISFGHPKLQPSNIAQKR